MAQSLDVHSGLVGATSEQLLAAHERDLANQQSIQRARAAAGLAQSTGNLQSADDGSNIVLDSSAQDRIALIIRTRDPDTWGQETVVCRTVELGRAVRLIRGQAP